MANGTEESLQPADLTRNSMGAPAPRSNPGARKRRSTSTSAPPVGDSVTGRHEGVVITAILMFAFASSAALLTRKFPILPNGVLVISPDNSAQVKSAQISAATRDSHL
jgi:hypothetical protein